MSLVGLRVVPVGSIVGRKPRVVGETGLAHRLPQPPSRLLLRLLLLLLLHRQLLLLLSSVP